MTHCEQSRLTFRVPEMAYTARTLLCCCSANLNRSLQDERLRQGLACQPFFQQACFCCAGCCHSWSCKGSCPAASCTATLNSLLGIVGAHAILPSQPSI